MANLSWQFNIPKAHIQQGRTASTFSGNRDDYVPPVQVQFSTTRPKDAFVSVFAHDHWFYIDQNDRHSKRAFSFLELLLNLAETGVQAAGPIMTISN